MAELPLRTSGEVAGRQMDLVLCLDCEALMQQDPQGFLADLARRIKP